MSFLYLLFFRFKPTLHILDLLLFFFHEKCMNASSITTKFIDLCIIQQNSLYHYNFPLINRYIIKLQKWGLNWREEGKVYMYSESHYWCPTLIQRERERHGPSSYLFGPKILYLILHTSIKARMFGLMWKVNMGVNRILKWR